MDNFDIKGFIASKKLYEQKDNIEPEEVEGELSSDSMDVENGFYYDDATDEELEKRKKYIANLVRQNIAQSVKDNKDLIQKFPGDKKLLISLIKKISSNEYTIRGLANDLLENDIDFYIQDTIDHIVGAYTGQKYFKSKNFDFEESEMMNSKIYDILGDEDKDRVGTLRFKYNKLIK